MPMKPRAPRPEPTAAERLAQSLEVHIARRGHTDYVEVVRADIEEVAEVVLPAGPTPDVLDLLDGAKAAAGKKAKLKLPGQRIVVLVRLLRDLLKLYESVKGLQIKAHDATRAEIDKSQAEAFKPQ